MSSKSLLCNIRTHWVKVNILEWKVSGMKNLKLLFIRNKRKLHLSFQRMQPLARSVKRFKLNRQHGVFQELLFLNFSEIFLTQQLRKTILMPKYVVRVTFTKSVVLNKFEKICIATKWKKSWLKSIKFYRFCF